MKKLMLFLLALVLVILPIACGGSGDATSETNAVSPETGSTSEGAVSTTATTSAPETTTSTAPSLPEGVTYMNILLMGIPEKDVDSGPGGWAITHVLMTLDPVGRVVKFTQFPYNLEVEVDTPDGLQAWPLQEVSGEYGEGKVVETLQKAFGVEVDHWAIMNLPGLAATVDAMGGLEIDVQSLSINEAAAHVVGFLLDGYEWQEVTQTGPQTLSGVQAAAYMVDTVPESGDPLKEEELLFRDRHENFLKAVITSLKRLGTTADDIIALAGTVAGTYSTSIPEEDWPVIAQTVLYCLEQDPQFMFVPKEIVAAEGSRRDLMYDEAVDVAAVQGFIAQK